jgi:hypothetical protein
MKFLQITLSIAVIAMISCNDQTSISAKTKGMHTDVAVVKKDFSKIQFASKLDYSCFMPLTAGLEDTAIVNGKVYGFCSKECKDEFMKDAVANVKAGEAHELSFKK